MDFYHELYDVLRRSQRGLRAPQPPLEEIAAVLAHSRRAVILTGFPVDCAGHAVGETDGPQGAAEIAAVLAALMMAALPLGSLADEALPSPTAEAPAEPTAEPTDAPSTEPAPTP